MISFAPVLPPETRLFTVVGHFGSGKTEFAVNLALALREERDEVALADLDVVDPYFRSRECEPLLVQRGIRLISSANTCRDADLPSMPAEVNVLLDNPSLTGVLDIGGDPSGARVLARYRRRIGENSAALLCVINANRPLSDTADKCIDYIRRIETACGMSVTFLPRLSMPSAAPRLPGKTRATTPGIGSAARGPGSLKQIKGDLKYVDL